MNWKNGVFQAAKIRRGVSMARMSTPNLIKRLLWMGLFKAAKQKPKKTPTTPYDDIVYETNK